MLPYAFPLSCAEDGPVVLATSVDPYAPYCPDSWEALGGRSLEAMDAVETFAAVHDGCLISSSDEMTIAFHFPVLKDSERKNCKCYC